VHIPDGYLSPETCAAGAAVMVPVFVKAGRKVHRTVKSRYVPLLAICAAYCFLVMMFNVPIPDGTTAHAIGAVLVAVILGPDAAIIAVATALVIQALFFGDGGVLALGVNAFNMAFVMTTVGYYLVYRPLSRNASLTSPRRAFAAALGGYVGISAAALCAGIELGIQPDLFHTAAGAPLYSPYHVAQAVPAMLLAHLTVAGGVEFALTFGVVAYLQRANLPVLRINHESVPETGEAARAPLRLRWWYLLAPLALMALLTPLGLLAPGGAFGETNPRANRSGFLAATHLSSIPAGLARYSGFWHHALLNGYGFGHGTHRTAGYLVSAFFGTVVISAVLLGLFGLAHLAKRLAARHRKARAEAMPVPALAAPALPALAALAAAEHASPARTPSWLLQGEVGLCPCGCIGKRRKGSFVEKTLGGAASVMRQALFGSDVASSPGLLQRIDARVKLVTMLAVLVAAALVRNTVVLLGLYGALLALAAASRLKVSFFVKRVWLFIPIFTGVVVAPATLSIITRGQIVLPLGHWWFGHAVGVTRQGLDAAGLIVTRVAVSISIVVLLTLTTPWSQLLAALRALSVPRIFIQVMGMAYRYIFHLLGSVDDMYAARKARMVGAERDYRAGRSFVAATAGALVGKAHGLSEEVYQAMVSRGYTGSARTLEGFRIGRRELVWAATCALAVAATLGLDRLLVR
jgi:cobalt/nickel transport system permease protein